jgi:hypothetical protein
VTSVPSSTPVPTEHGILLHIGPHKTGTTAIQGALAASRSELLQNHGILYPGATLAHNRQAVSALLRSPTAEGAEPSRRRWENLLTVVRAHTGRTVISSEVFCEASDDAARRIIEDLGSERLRVVITLRPLEKLLPSNWQQYIKSGYRTGYDAWLKNVLETRDARPVTPSFWIRNNHPALIKRWSDLVGMENVVLVVVDTAVPRNLFDSFEDLLGLERHSLNAGDSGPSNRSLSVPEVELLRRVNRLSAKAVTPTDYTRFVKHGAVARLVEERKPGPGEGRVTTPRWAVERAREFSRSDVAAIADMDLRVMGDLSSLAPDQPIADESVAAAGDAVPADLAASFAFSLLQAGIEVAETEKATAARRAARQVKDAVGAARAAVRPAVPETRGPTPSRLSRIVSGVRRRFTARRS